MAKYRQSLLRAAEDLGPAGTEIINIDVTRPISQIEITFKTTKASQGMSAGAPANIPKIELLDGSRRLHSLTGYENQALAYYNRPGRSMDHGQHIDGLSEVDTYVIDFGRWLWDEQLAFDPNRFSNPRLEITWDENISDTSVSANELEIWAHIFDDKQISPAGFLSAIEHHSYTPGADNSFERIELDEDRPIRQILVRGFRDGFEPWTTIKEIRFDENTQERIPFEYTDLEMYYRRMKSTWPLITQMVALAPGTGGSTYYLPMTDFNMGLSFLGMGGTTEAFINAASGKGGKLALVVSVSVNITGIAYGYLPWHCYQFPMGRPMDIDDWYDPAGKKPIIRLRAGSNGTNGAGQLVTEELFRY